jgi:hypothetical protein
MSTPSSIEVYCREFYRALASRPLPPDDPKYVEIFERPELSASDPVRSLLQGIEWSPSTNSVQLFSGFRGTGKSTSLLRLERDLVARGDLVVLCDMGAYLNLSAPIDISDFLVTVAGAFGEQLARPDLLGKDAAKASYWERFVGFVKSAEVDLSVSAGHGLGGLDIRANLKADPLFKKRVQSALAGRLGALAADVQAFMADCVARLRARHGAERRVVLLLDSIEHLQGTSADAPAIYDSLENLFAGHPDKLRFQSLHVIYTVPPWLKIRSPGVEAHYDGGELLPCVKVVNRDGSPNEPALEVLREVVGKRGEWTRLMGRASLDRVIEASGGYIRDLLRLLQSCLRLADQRDTLPLDRDGDALVELVLADVRSDYLPIANADVAWLDRVRRTATAQLERRDDLPTLARFFDSHLVLCYRTDGEDWYAVHPLLAEQIAEQAAQGGAAPSPAEGGGTE